MSLSQGLTVSFMVLASIYLLFAMDDIWIDVVAFIKKLRPKELKNSDLQRISVLPEKNIAIIVPAWDEGPIIKRMLRGNRQRIQYENYHFFVGCYPNDPETVQALQEMEQEDSRVHSVVNFKDGPTNKGQMLNWVVDSILDYERKANVFFHAFLMQDSEDLIHPLSLKLINEQLDHFDYVQVPVFSLALKPSELVAGLYVDEFAESHTKNILVRQALGGGVPSAGVGTALSRKLVQGLQREQNGQVLRDGSLTEDYEMGLLTALQGWSQIFACFWYRLPTGRKEFIATREYFPKSFLRSIRQKTRWTLGIAIQGWRQLGWQGGGWYRYFLWRDRKGLVASPAMIVGYLWALVFTAVVASPWYEVSDIFQNIQVRTLGILTAAASLNRVMQRFICVTRVYGGMAALMIPVRLPVGNIINACAVWNAVVRDVKAKLGRGAITWAKTTHELPEGFGQVQEIESPTSTPLLESIHG